MHTHDSLIGDIVAADFRSAAVFEKYGIDFCCGGQRSLDAACRQLSIDPATVATALSDLDQAAPSEPDLVAAAPTDQLVAHIVSHHHAYLRRSMPLISGHLAKLVHVHGARHHELERVAAEFDNVHNELQHHLLKEEHILFPWVGEMFRAVESGRPVPIAPFGTVRNPIRMMEDEHQQAGDELRVIRDLTAGFAVPGDGCTTYSVTMAELAEFEQDLHRHIHLENNVLFPRAVAMENGGRAVV